MLRILCGVQWGAFAIILAAGAVGEWLISIPARAVLCLVVAVGCGWYDCRVCTFKAKLLWIGVWPAR